MPKEKDTGFTAALNEVDDMITAMQEKPSARWDYVPLKLHIVALRIENEKLLAMHQQTDQLRRIAEALSDISGSAQAMEPKVPSKL